MALLDKLIGTVAPHTCLVCEREGGLVCQWCLPDAFPVLPSRCYRCQAKTKDNRVCQRCRHATVLRHVWVRTDYDDLAKRLVHSYKFLHARAAAHEIALLICQDLPYFENAILVPVPTVTSRVRQRGFDHTLLLTRQLAKRLSLPYEPDLERLGQSRQVGTKREQRIYQIKDKFVVRKDVKGKHILLVDDVITTGATIEEASLTLKRAGAAQVDAIVFAKAK